MQHLSFLWITQNNIKAQSFIQLISRMIYWTWCVWFLLEAKSKMKFKKNSCDLLWEMPVQYGEEVRDDEKIPSNWAAVLTTVKKRMLECYIGSVLDPGQFQERFGQAIRNPQAPNSPLICCSQCEGKGQDKPAPTPCLPLRFKEGVGDEVWEPSVQGFSCWLPDKEGSWGKTL